MLGKVGDRGSVWPRWTSGAGSTRGVRGVAGPGVLDLLIHYKGPQGLKRAGYQRVLNWMIKHTRKDPTPLVDDIFEALKAQIVTVPGSDAAELVIPQLAATIKALKEQRNTIAEQVEEMLADFPLCEVLMSMPGIGIKTAAQILLAIGDGFRLR